MLRKVGRLLGINKLLRPILDLKGYENQFHQRMINKLQENDIFWDVGSNQGEIVKKVKSFFNCNVYCVAFEPNPDLLANLKKLSFKNYKVINAALSNKVGKAEFVYGSDTMQTTGKLDTSSRKKQNKTMVQEIDIRYALKVLNLKCPNLIKIDVEGHEYEILSSILLNLENLKILRFIFVEIHLSILDKRGLTIQMKDLIEKFELETNFEFKWIDVSHFILER
ncbi:MAG: hypothetical protein CL851_04070 [Crocinitomicaceae bacterium]|nr:hypothetical protein [Crocinitomicaceae bacterium]